MKIQKYLCVNLAKLWNQKEEWKSIVWKLPESPVFSDRRQTERKRKK